MVEGLDSMLNKLYFLGESGGDMVRTRHERRIL